MYNTATRSWELTDESGTYDWIIRAADREAVRDMSDTKLNEWIDALIESLREEATNEIEGNASEKSYPLMYYSTTDIIEDEATYIERETESLEDDLKAERDTARAFILAWAWEDELDSVMTASEVQIDYHITRDAVHKAITRGQIPARQSASTWLIRRADAEARWGKAESVVWDSTCTVFRDEYQSEADYLKAYRACNQHYDFKTRVDGGWKFFEFVTDYNTYKAQR